MKIALVHDWLTGMRGGEKCLEILCRRFPDARLFTLLHRRGSLSPTIERMDITTSFLQKIPGATRHYRYLLPLMPRAIESLNQPHKHPHLPHNLPGNHSRSPTVSFPENLDLVVSLSHAVAKGVRPPPGVPHLCYCFTPMRYAWELRDQYFGLRDGSPGRRRWTPRAWLHRTRDQLLDRVREWDYRTRDRVDHYVAISQTIASRITGCYGRPSKVVYPPVDTEFYTPADVRREDYYLCVSALAPYKRIDLAVEACRRLGKRLVVIGAGPEAGRLQTLAGAETRFLGWRDNATIRDHLRRCRALLFPGREDFGIVPVEAQACGAAVIAFGQGGATETVLPSNSRERGTGLFFSEQTVDSLATAIARLEANPEQCDATMARRQAETFHAERFERELIDEMKRVAAPREPIRRAA